MVPQVWKDATIAPIPKETPATISKLRPISLTSLLAKVCEGFVANWVLDDISSAIYGLSVWVFADKVSLVPNEGPITPQTSRAVFLTMLFL